MTSGAGSVFKYDPANSPTEVAGTVQKFDEASQLSEAGSTKYVYNEVGERIEVKPKEGPVTKYGFDQAGNLISATKEASFEDSYAYDGNRQRSSEKVSGVKAQLTWDNVSGEQPRLLYDGTRYYIYGPDGAPFVQIAGTTVVYLHHDQRGSTRLLTNSLGEAKGKYTYTPYGAVEEFVGSTSTPLGFGGQYRNESTGLIHTEGGEFDPATAQYLSRSHGGQEESPYGYGESDPVSGGLASQAGQRPVQPEPPEIMLLEPELIRSTSWEPISLGWGAVVWVRWHLNQEYMYISTSNSIWRHNADGTWSYAGPPAPPTSTLFPESRPIGVLTPAIMDRNRPVVNFDPQSLSPTSTSPAWLERLLDRMIITSPEELPGLSPGQSTLPQPPPVMFNRVFRW
jgi:RHS repeat-associated protein